MATVCRVILIGMMGSGKSTIGRQLSDATGWPYLDNDDFVRETHGATPRQILAEHGEERMRAAESEALVAALATPAPAIVGVAAGTILDPANQERLRDGGIVVWCRAAPSVLAERAKGADHRPWLEGDAEAWMREASAERDPLYASVADLTIDTDTGSPADAVAAIRDWLATDGRCI